MTLYVVRHAHAGNRSEWQGEDRQRPLSTKGQRQARALCDLLAVDDLRTVRSSPAVRCVETIRPLAERAGREVETVEHLAEEQDPQQTVALLERLVDCEGDHVVCAHGDQLPAVVVTVANRQGGHLSPGVAAKKGSTWILHREADGSLTTRYLAAPK